MLKYGNMPFCDSWASIYAYKNEDLIERSFLRCEHYVHPSIPIYKYKCTSIIKTKKKKIQNPVDPAGPDCYRIDTKPCESL